MNSELIVSWKRINGLGCLICVDNSSCIGIKGKGRERIDPQFCFFGCSLCVLKRFLHFTNRTLMYCLVTAEAHILSALDLSDRKFRTVATAVIVHYSQ
jgi:hypothetical protein